MTSVSPVLHRRSAHPSTQERPPHAATGRRNHLGTLQCRVSGALIDILENGWGADTDSATENLREGTEPGLQIRNGVIVHDRGDKGLDLGASTAVTSYCIDDRLN